MTVLRLIVSALGALWLLAGLLTVYVAGTTPVDPDRETPEYDAAKWVLFVWYAIWIVLLGPIALGTAIEHRDKMWSKILARRGGTS